MPNSEFEASALRDYRWLHQHPELSMGEFGTSAYIRTRLSTMPGVELIDTGLPTGVLARIAGDPAGAVIGLRADIDALAICEETGLPYASLNSGVMHACGHDLHTAALLTVAELLGRQAHDLPGTVVLIFQPAEENAHGAQSMIDTGFLERERIQAMFAMHVSARHPVGTIAIGPGAFNAAVDRFSYEIIGSGGHASAPHEGLDPIPVAARLVGSISDIVSRHIDATKPVVISVSQFHAGMAWNVMPESAQLEGTVRSFHPEVRTQTEEALAREAEAVRALGYRVNFHWQPGCPATDNDPALAELIANVARGRGFNVVPQPRRMGGEDFACFQACLPAAMFDLGIGSPHPLHHPLFTADPTALFPAAQLMAEIARRALAEAAASL